MFAESRQAAEPVNESINYLVNTAAIPASLNNPNPCSFTASDRCRDPIFAFFVEFMLCGVNSKFAVNCGRFREALVRIDVTEFSLNSRPRFSR